MGSLRLAPIILENVEHCGGEPEQADTVLVLGARGRLCSLSTCCLSPGVLREAPSRVQGKACQWSLSCVQGRTSQYGYICMDQASH